MSALDSSNSAELAATPRPWERASWFERLTPRIGLQGKLLLWFMALLTLSLGASCVIFMSQTANRLNDILGQQTQQLATENELVGLNRVALSRERLG